MKKLDATKYKFERSYPGKENDPFHFIKFANEPELTRVEDVKFTNLDNTWYEKNGERFSYYGSGSVEEHAATLLSDGSILFCIVRGMAFTDSFSSSENIQMRYYKATLIDEK